MTPMVGKLFSPIDPKIASPVDWPELDLDTLLYPPDEWFTDETADAAPPKLAVLASGQVWGVVGPAGRCILDGRPGCWTIPRPADGRGSQFDCADDAELRLAHVGTTVLASGTEIPTGTLAGAGGHHSFFHTPDDPAKSEYADTDRAVARGRYVWSDVAGGMVFVGALMPTIDEVKIAVTRCSAVSVDYRYMPDEGRHVLYGSCLVNLGGLPSRYVRPVMAGVSTFIPDAVLAAAMEQHTVGYQIDGEPPDGAMIALLPDDPGSLVEPGGEPAESLHITMRYLGKAVDWPPAARATLVANIGALLDESTPAAAEFDVAAVAQIGPNGAGALIMNGDVAELRAALAETAAGSAQADGVEMPDDHAGFIPHLTLRWDGQLPPSDRIGTSFTASTIRVVFADEATDFHLGQQADNPKEPIMATATTTCSCGKGPKLAAYRLVDGTGVPYGAEVTLPDGRSAQLDGTVKALDGSDVYLVLPVEDGKLASYDERVAVPAAEAVLTGKRFEWEEMDSSYDAVLAAASRAGIPEASTRAMLAAADVAAPDGAQTQELSSKLDEQTGLLQELVAKVTDIHQATLDQKIAELGPLPV